VQRWQLEVTFQEVRANDGFETQRQWSDLAIARTSPILRGLFSLITVLANRLASAGQLPIPPFGTESSSLRSPTRSPLCVNTIGVFTISSSRPQEGTL
jgi:hypothetical protein